MTPQLKPQIDDPEIANADSLYRHIKNYSQLAKHDDGHYILSSMVFAQNGDGCSVEIESLILADGQTAATRRDANNSIAIVAVTVQQVRTLRYGKPIALGPGLPKKPQGKLSIAYTPIAEGEEGGPNPYHADIFPGPTDSANKQLTQLAKAREPIIQIDQAQAEIEYAKRFSNGATG